MRKTPTRPKILFIWDQFGAYHMDRCEAVGRALAGNADVVGIELSAVSNTYAWDRTSEGLAFEKRSLFDNIPAEDLRMVNVVRALMRDIRSAGVHAVYISGYERPSHFIVALLTRLLGKRVIVMLDSKYDDKPRRHVLEIFKRGLMAPYNGGFAAGRRSAEYLYLLGLRKRPVTTGYDTVALDRIRALAAGDRVPPWAQRAFVAVARYVPKKNLAFLIAVYAKFREMDPLSPRRLVLCGGGPLESELRSKAAELGVEEWVDFTGFVGQSSVASYLASALCLLLPSTEEQWGLVVNEALAFSLPVILSSNVGAIDSLAENGGNGFICRPNDKAEWVQALVCMASDEDMWMRMADRSKVLAPLGDVEAFVRGALPHLRLD